MGLRFSSKFAANIATKKSGRMEIY